MKQYPNNLVLLEDSHSEMVFTGKGRNRKQQHVFNLLLGNHKWEDKWGVLHRHRESSMGPTLVSSPLSNWDSLNEYLKNKMSDANTPNRFVNAALMKYIIMGFMCFSVPVVV